MCGLIAVLGNPHEETLRAGVIKARARGPHSHGWAQLLGEVRVRFGDGPLPMPARAHRSPRADEPVLVGHSRLATTSREAGSLPRAAEGQPLLGTRWLLAHNGTVPSLVSSDGREPHDSRGLLERLEAQGLAGLNDSALWEGRPQAMIVYDLSTAQLYLVRVTGDRLPAHPLYVTTSPTGSIVSSGPVSPESQLAPEGVTELKGVP